MKKSLLSLLLVTTMLIMLVLPASAATGSLNASAKLNGDGTGFTVDITVKDNPGIIAMTGKVSYDSQVFKLKEVKNGEIFEGIFMSSQNKKVNPYQTIWMEATAEEDIKTNGVLATYTFEVLKNAPLGESEIKFEIAEVVNFKQDSSSQFTGCSFKVNVRSNSAEAESEPVTSISSNSVSNDQPLNVQKPLVDNTADEDEASSEVQSTEQTETTSSDVAVDMTENNDEYDDDEGDVENKDRTLVTLITIAVVLVLGLAVTFTALYFRKKSGNGNNQE